MSLKTFHIVFVTLATLMSVLAAVFCLRIMENPDLLFTVTGYISAFLAVILPIYGVAFYKKIKQSNI